MKIISTNDPNRYVTLKRDLLVTLIPELGKTKDDEAGRCKQHGIQEDESTNGEVRVVAQDEDCSKGAGGERHSQFLRGIVSERNHDSSKEGIEDAHETVIDIGIRRPRLKRKRSVVASQGS